MSSVLRYFNTNYCLKEADGRKDMYEKGGIIMYNMTLNRHDAMHDMMLMNRLFNFSSESIIQATR